MTRLCLPQNAGRQNRAERTRNLFAQRSAYRWVHAPGQPPFCEGVPEGEAFSTARADLLKFDVAESVADLALSAVVNLFSHNDRVTSFNRYYPLRPLPAVAHRWTRDGEFARQRLDGINPFMITLATGIPEKFPVTDETLRGLLPEGVTVAQLLDERRLFLVDFEALQGMAKVMGCFQTAPVALFWLDPQRKLMPLAIQLGQSPAEAPVIFTPLDDRWLWLMARTHLQCADGTYHEVVSHLTRTHMVMETFWVAACRTLPPEHPLHELFKPHFKGTVEINYEARNTLIAPGGPIDESIAVGAEGSLTLLGEEYARWSFDQFDPRVEIERRGVIDPSVLPGYHYRDDALELYSAIREYISELLRVYYKNDEDVQQDEELQAWIRELVSEDGGQVKGLPVENGSVRKFDDLQQIVSQIIFLCSVEHAAVNNGQYDQFGYIPNTPGAMYLPAPVTKEPRSEANFVYALPPAHAVGEQLTLVHLLSLETQTPLGDYPDTFFQGSGEAWRAVDRFRGRLEDIGRKIHQRNKNLEVPYCYLDPPEIGRSIDI